MQTELQERNRCLLRDLNDLLEFIAQAQLPDELQPFKVAVEATCHNGHQTVLKNLSKLQSPEKARLLLEEVMSDTAIVINRTRLMDEILIPALIRDPFATLLSLKIVSWLHNEHPQTQLYSPVITDGSWGIYPLDLPVYYVPLLQQHRLLQQSLLIHEFGHKLYRHHKTEMDELVKEFQFKVLQVLTLPFASNDKYYEQQLAYTQAVAFTWYRWMQELFCDAVGFQIGGPCYLKAFSTALSSMQKGDFHVEQDDLIGSSHPVAWLRVQFLSQRARSQGFRTLANQIEHMWWEAASALKITEDYYGMYDSILEKYVVDTLEDMLIEADPRGYHDEELQPLDTIIDYSPIALLNKAWIVYETSPESYPEWEKSVINQYLGVN